MIEFLPRPIRDFVETVSSIRDIPKANRLNGNDYISTPYYSNLDFYKSAHLIHTCCRTALAAFGVLTVCATGASVPVAFVVGTVVSLPATLLVGGAFGIKYGTAAVIAALATGSFESLVIGMGSFAGGVLALEYYDFKPFGFAEPVIRNFAENYWEPVTNVIRSL